MELLLKKNTVYNQLKRDIISGKLRAGEKLPQGVDLAKELGVSHNTLRSAMAKLEKDGYIAMIHGKGTFVYPDNAKSQATSTIMVLHGNDSGFEAPWRYIVPEVSRNAAEKQLKSFISTDAAMNIFSESDICEFVKANNVIGIVSVMSNFNGTEPVISKMKAAGVPVVITHGRMTDTEITGFASICVPEMCVWEDAIAYLAGLGHKKIGIIGSAPASSYTSRVCPFRFNTYEQTLGLLEKYHAQAIPELIKTATFDKDKINKAVEELFQYQQKPTAILCFSDFFAIYVYETLKQMKLRIPEDVAVMGICGYPDARLLNPPLSTIDYGYAELGKLSVEMLEQPEKWFDSLTLRGKQRVKPYKLVKRQSTELK
ncbi:MAG: GntR family transcriptional regulator [Victivallaceae bacterium]|jgi:DNA-binding LacI/PurR family transcriptional regulator